MVRVAAEGGLVALGPRSDAARRVALGLHGLSHRGPAAGMLALARGKELLRGAGDAVGLASGESAAVVGCAGAPSLLAGGLTRDGEVAVALLGRLTAAEALRAELRREGGVLPAGDAALVLHMMARSSQRSLAGRVVEALLKGQGSFAGIVLSGGQLLAFRDPRGLVPLVVGRVEGTLALASEGLAIEAMGGEVLREVGPGELVLVERDQVTALRPFPPRARAKCALESLSLGRSDAADVVLRRALGIRLAALSPVPGLEGVVAPRGAEACGLGFAEGGRSALLPALGCEDPGAAALAEGLEDLNLEARAALRPLSAWLKGKVVALVLDHLAAEEGVQRLARALRAGGAAAVHLRVCSPPLRARCALGVRFPPLAPATPDPEVLGVDSLAFLPGAELDRALADHSAGWCTACLGGPSPLLEERGAVEQLEMFRGKGGAE